MGPDTTQKNYQSKLSSIQEKIQSIWWCSLNHKNEYMSPEMFVQGLQFIKQSLLSPIISILALHKLHEGHEYLGAPEISRKIRHVVIRPIFPDKKKQEEDRRGRAEDYTEAKSAGVVRSSSGYFSSRIPTMTSESATHLSSILMTGTFPSGLMSKNLSTIVTNYLFRPFQVPDDKLTGLIRNQQCSLYITQETHIIWFKEKRAITIPCGSWLSLFLFPYPESLPFLTFWSIKLYHLCRLWTYYHCFTFFFPIRFENSSPFLSIGKQGIVLLRVF